MDRRARLDLQVRAGSLVPLERLVPPVRKARMGFPEHKEQLDLRGLLELRVLREPPVLLGLPVLREAAAVRVH